MSQEPIWIRCEGSGSPVHKPGHVWGICAMCGNPFTSQTNGIADNHRRKDVLAMLRRGDFG